jgi:hypothetical protein
VAYSYGNIYDPFYTLKSTDDLLKPSDQWVTASISGIGASILSSANEVVTPGVVNGSSLVEMVNEKLYLNWFKVGDTNKQLEETSEDSWQEGTQILYHRGILDIPTGVTAQEKYNPVGPFRHFTTWHYDEQQVYVSSGTAQFNYSTTNIWPEGVSVETNTITGEEYRLNQTLNPDYFTLAYPDSVSSNKPTRELIDGRGLTPLDSHSPNNLTVNTRFVNISSSPSGKLPFDIDGVLPFASPYEQGSIVYADKKESSQDDAKPIFRRFETATYWSKFIHSGRRYFEVTLLNAFNPIEIEDFTDHNVHITVGVIDIVPFRTQKFDGINVLNYSAFVDDNGWVYDSRNYPENYLNGDSGLGYGTSSPTRPDRPNIYSDHEYTNSNFDGTRFGFTPTKVPKFKSGDTIGVEYNISSQTLIMYLNGNQIFSSTQSEKGVNLETLIGFVDVRNAKAKCNTGREDFIYAQPGVSPWGQQVVVG